MAENDQSKEEKPVEKSENDAAGAANNPQGGQTGQQNQQQISPTVSPQTEGKPQAEAMPAAPKAAEPTVVDKEPPVVTEETSNMKWVVVIVVLVLLIIALGGGAFYYLTQYKYKPSDEIISPVSEDTNMMKPTATPEDKQTKELQTVGSSDEINAIDKDLQNTSLDNIDQEMNDIGKQLQ